MLRAVGFMQNAVLGAEFRGGNVHVLLEETAETADRLEARFVGNFRNILGRGGQELLRQVELQLLLVARHRDTRNALKERAQQRIAHAETSRNIGRREVRGDILAQQHLCLVDLVGVLVAAIREIDMLVVDAAKQVRNHASDDLLRTTDAALRVGDHLVIETYDRLANAHLEQRILLREEVVDDRLGLMATETDPHLTPTRLGVGVVEVALTGDEQDDRTCLDRTQITRIGLEEAFAFGDIDQLIFVERTALLRKVIVARVSRYGVLLVGVDILVANRGADQAPFLILRVRRKVFQEIVFVGHNEIIRRLISIGKNRKNFDICDGDFILLTPDFGQFTPEMAYIEPKMAGNVIVLSKT